MMLDRLLAMGHHLLAFGLLGILVAQSVELRRAGSDSWLARLSIIDRLYGVTAILLVVVGSCRVVFGIKGVDFYLANDWFWGKMAAFAIVGALSIVPTLTILRWSRRREQVPPAAEVARVRRFVQFQLVLFPSIPLMAALMATGGL